MPTEIEEKAEIVYSILEGPGSTHLIRESPCLKDGDATLTFRALKGVVSLGDHVGVSYGNSVPFDLKLRIIGQMYLGSSEQISLVGLHVSVQHIKKSGFYQFPLTLVYYGRYNIRRREGSFRCQNVFDLVDSNPVFLSLIPESLLDDRVRKATADYYAEMEAKVCQSD